MSNSDNSPSDTNTLDFDLSPSARSVITKQMHCMSYGLDALDGLSLILADSIDNDIGITGNQVTGLLKCVEYSLLTTQRRMVKALQEN
jgi:hypothetical protein